MKSVKFFCVVLLLSFVIGPVFAQEAGIQIKDGYWRYYKPAERAKTPADRTKALEQGEGGVLFMATAKPEDASVLSDPKKPIVLSYNKGGKDGARLTVKIGGASIAVKGLYDWILLPAVYIAQTGFTNGTTLQGTPDPGNAEEASRADFYLNKQQGGTAVSWVEVNPVLVNTLLGYNMLLADAMLTEGEVGKAAADISLPGYNETKLKPADKKKADAAVDAANKQVKDIILKGRTDWAKGKAREVVWQQIFATGRTPNEDDMVDAINAMYTSYMPEAKPWDYYIFCDPDEGIKFKVDKKGLIFTGAPQYYFMYKNTDSTGRQVYQDAKVISADMKKVVRGLNPIVYDSITQAAQWTAFFRLAKSKYPKEWDKFVAQVKANVTPPDAKTGNGYVYNLDAGYRYETPRIFDPNSEAIKKAYAAMGKLK